MGHKNILIACLAGAVVLLTVFYVLEQRAGQRGYLGLEEWQTESLTPFSDLQAFLTDNKQVVREENDSLVYLDFLNSQTAQRFGVDFNTASATHSVDDNFAFTIVNPFTGGIVTVTVDVSRMEKDSECQSWAQNVSYYLGRLADYARANGMPERIINSKDPSQIMRWMRRNWTQAQINDFLSWSAALGQQVQNLGQCALQYVVTNN